MTTLSVYEAILDQLAQSVFLRIALIPASAEEDPVDTILEKYRNDPLNEENVDEIVGRIARSRDKSSLKYLLKRLGLVERNTSLDSRLHVSHSLNVFFLGLLLVSKNESLQNSLLELPGRFQVQSLKGERQPFPEIAYDSFFIRWLCASIFHDVGYVDYLAARENDGQHKRAVIKKIYELQQTSFLLPYEEKHDSTTRYDAKGERPESYFDLLAQVCSRQVEGCWSDEEICRKELQHLNDCALDGNSDFSPNHSVLSSIQMAVELYRHYLSGRAKDGIGAREKDSDRLTWNRDIFLRDLMDGVLAVFLHNILNHQKEKFFDDHGYVTPRTFPPLTLLLLLCDLLVEWDKPENHLSDNDDFSGNEVGVDFDDSGKMIIVYPRESNRINDLKSTIDKCFGKNFDLIEVRTREGGRNRA